MGREVAGLRSSMVESGQLNISPVIGTKRTLVIPGHSGCGYLTETTGATPGHNRNLPSWQCSRHPAGRREEMIREVAALTLLPGNLVQRYPLADSSWQ